MAAIYNESVEEFANTTIGRSIKEISENPECWNLGRKINDAWKSKAIRSARDVSKYQKSELKITLNLNEGQLRLLNALVVCLGETRAYFVYKSLRYEILMTMQARLEAEKLKDKLSLQEAFDIYQAWGGDDEYILRQFREEIATASHDTRKEDE